MQLLLMNKNSVRNFDSSDAPAWRSCVWNTAWPNPNLLVDSERTQTYTRYYLARRVDGNPAMMGWETKPVHLVPLAQLAQLAVHPNDKPVIAALVQMKSTGLR
jgi:hypothetical protein